MSFNRLTPAQAERLALLAEECAEVIVIVGKILRHGYESSNPLSAERVPNRTLLEDELGDVDEAVEMLFLAGDVSQRNIDAARERKHVSVQQWLHHQAEP